MHPSITLQLRAVLQEGWGQLGLPLSLCWTRPLRCNPRGCLGCLRYICDQCWSQQHCEGKLPYGHTGFMPKEFKPLAVYST